jgi:hypothetical protein
LALGNGDTSEERDWSILADEAESVGPDLGRNDPMVALAMGYIGKGMIW